MPGGIQVYKFTGSREYKISAKLIARTPLEARANLIRLNYLRAWMLPYFGQQSAQAEMKQVDELKNSSSLPSLPNSMIPNIEFGDINTGKVGNLITNPTAIEQTVKNQKAVATNLLGAPPEVLYLSAYSGGAIGGKLPRSGNIDRIPVVMTSLSIPYTNEVDYIPSSTTGVSDPFGGMPCPTVMTIDISLIEVHSPREYMKFSLVDFRDGKLVGF
jgi:hypothetical protein